MTYCHECRKSITNKQYYWSKDRFGKGLCKEHQPPEQNILASDKTPAIIKSKISGEKFNITKSTPEAKKLGHALLDMGWGVELGVWDGHKTIDIVVFNNANLTKVHIEVDGVHHNLSKVQALSDLKRTYHSLREGYLTLRIPNSLVKDDETIRETADLISEFLKESKKQLE